jgi:restriction system protein
MARRKQSSGLKDIFIIFSILPWWLGLIFAPLSYVFISSYALAPVFDTSNPTQFFINTAIYQAAAIFQYVIPALIILGSLKSLIGMLKRIMLLNGVRNAAHDDPAQAFAKISWAEFEMLVGQYFKELGYKVVETGGRADGGVDLRLRKATGELFLVQCKHWKTSKVPVNIVREIFGVMQAEQASGAFVVASGVFTKDAATFAKGKAIELLDGATLIAAIKQRPTNPALSTSTPKPTSTAVPMPQLNQAPQTKVEPVLSIQPATPACPICQSEMVQRTAKRGVNAGNSFFGCSKYPLCRGTLANG